MGLETAHVSHIFALNDGRALRVIVRPVALSSSTCTSYSIKTATNTKL